MITSAGAKWVGRILLGCAAFVIAVGLWKREEIMRLMVVNTIFEPDRIVHNFSHMDEAFLHRALPHGSTPVPLPKGAPMALPSGLPEWMTDRRVTSLVILKDGVLRHESYHLGTTATDVRISWSLAKSFISALTGVVIAEGAIASLNDPVTTYAPQLKGGAYDQSTVRHVLQMSTGVRFNEDFQDYHSDINRMGRVLALGRLMDDFAAALTETVAAPGSGWQYVSIDTHVLSMVLRGATGRSLIDLMGEKITGPLGLEAEAYYLTDGAGVAFALGGLNMTTRDYARFGQMMLQRGVWQGQRLIPETWVLASTTPSAPTTDGAYGYGYQWWMPHDARPREYMGRGIYGQYLYINEAERTVIALTAADPEFRSRHIQRENVNWFRMIAEAR